MYDFLTRASRALRFHGFVGKLAVLHASPIAVFLRRAGTRLPPPLTLMRLAFPKIWMVRAQPAQSMPQTPGSRKRIIPTAAQCLKKSYRSGELAAPGVRQVEFRLKQIPFGVQHVEIR